MEFVDNEIKNALLTEFGNYLMEKQPTLELWGEVTFSNFLPGSSTPTTSLYTYDAEFKPGHVRNTWDELFEDQARYPERYRIRSETWAYVKSRVAAIKGIQTGCYVMMGYLKMGSNVFLPVADNAISLDISRLPAIPIDITGRPNTIRFNFGPGEYLELDWGPSSVLEEVVIGNLRPGEMVTRNEVVAFTDFTFTYN